MSLTTIGTRSVIAVDVQTGVIEVARKMKRKPGAVRMLWVRALARLRDVIEDLTSGSPSGV